jgi:hypothetical protein
MVTLPATILFKSKPLLVVDAAESGIPSWVVAGAETVDAGMVISKLPPDGMVEPIVRAMVQIPD